jgi:hypothetical protein
VFLPEFRDTYSSVDDDWKDAWIRSLMYRNNKATDLYDCATATFGIAKEIFKVFLHR